MFAGEELFKRTHAVHRAWVGAAAEAYTRLHPDAGACAWSADEAVALFAGDGNPLTQCYGLGIGEGDPADKLDAVARFFAGRTEKWELILSPFEAATVWNRAVDFGLRFDHFENLLFMPVKDLGPAVVMPPEMSIDVPSPEHGGAWADLSMRAFMGDDRPPFADDLKSLLGATRFSRRYWGLWDGEPVAAATATTVEGAVFLGGMGTLEAFRKRGFQAAMLDRRVRDAAPEADLALMEALPGSSSHRNAERLGFRVAYTSSVLVFDASPGK